MPVISADNSLCTVVVTVDASKSVMADLVEHARFGLRRFPDYEGFLGGALHMSDDGTRLVQYLQWESQTSYTASRDDSRWDEAASTRRFAEHVASGRARIDARTYEIVADTD